MTPKINQKNVKSKKNRKYFANNSINNCFCGLKELYLGSWNETENSQILYRKSTDRTCMRRGMELATISVAGTLEGGGCFGKNH